MSGVVLIPEMAAKPGSFPAKWKSAKEMLTGIAQAKEAQGESQI